VAQHLTIHLRSRLALAFALMLLGLQSVAPTPPAMAGLVLLLGLHILGYLWVRLAAAGVRVGRERQARPIFVGDSLCERLTIASRSWVPLLWAELHDASALRGYHGRAVTSLAPRAEATVTLEGRALRRGIYALGPVTITLGDPFGLYEARLKVDCGARRVVYPRPVELPPWPQWTGIVPTEGPSGRDLVDHSPHAVTVRPYAPGDTLRHIHWRTTARRSLPDREALFVKEFDPQSSGNVWLALDMQDTVQFGEGESCTEERAVVLAASLSEQTLRRGRSVGLAALGAVATLVPPRPGPEQRWRLLEEMAGLRAEGEVPIGEALRRLARTVRRGDTVVVVTPSPDDAWLDGVRDLLWRGARVAAILLPADQDTLANAALTAALAELGVPYRTLDTFAASASRLAA